MAQDMGDAFAQASANGVLFSIAEAVSRSRRRSDTASYQIALGKHWDYSALDKPQGCKCPLRQTQFGLPFQF